MDMMQIGGLILLVAILVMILPRTLQAMKESPKGSGNDWLTFGGLMLAVVLFVLLLVKLV